MTALCDFRLCVLFLLIGFFYYRSSGFVCQLRFSESMEINFQKHYKKETENLRRGHEARTVTNQTRIKSFGRFLESGGGSGLSSGAAQSRRPPVQLC
jgi:hypothetical protein